MKKSLRIGLLGLLTGATAFAGALGLNLQKIERARADTNFTMEMVNGAEIRLIGTDEKEYGIKYTAKLATTSYDANSKYYVMIVPTGWLTKCGFSKEYNINYDYYDAFSKDTDLNNRIMRMEAVPEYVEEKGCYYFAGSIKTIKYENSFREFFGIAYSENTNGERTYAEFETGENIRSVSQVASAALNDKTKNWKDTEKASLKKMVKTAYNAAKDNDYTTQEEAELPQITAESAELSLLGGQTQQINTLTGVPQNIGIKVQYTSSSPAQVMVDENGLLTANTVGSGTTITATVLGEDYEVATVKPVENMLVGFDTKESEKNIVKITNGMNYLNAENEDMFASEWQESFAGRNGVVKTVTTNGGAYGQHCIYPLFDKTVEEMATLTSDFDYISIWIYVDAEGTYNARSYTHVLNAVEGKQWQEIRLTKEDIETGKVSYWVQNWGKANAIAKFNTLYAQKDSAVTELFQLNNGVKNAAPITVYIDSISYAKFDGEFVAPEKAGEFTLPAMQMNNNSQAPAVNVSRGTTSIDVVDGKATLPYSGDYNVEYVYNYNGLKYTQEFNFSVARGAMAANMLEDFDDPTSANNVGSGQLGNGEWMERFEVGGVEKTGVVKVTLTGADPGNLLYTRFNMTSEELLEKDFDTITATVFVRPHDLSKFSSTNRWVAFSFCGVSLGHNLAIAALTEDTVISKGVWVTKTITKDQLVSYAQNNARYTQQNTGDDLKNFYKLHDMNGTGRFLMASSVVCDVYIDSIMFAKNA